jgi:hypothetical protein
MGGKSEMAPWWGNALYWTATIIAGLIVVWGIWNDVYNTEKGEPIIQVAPFLLALAIWLAGWICRRVFTEHRSN